MAKNEGFQETFIAKSEEEFQSAKRFEALTQLLSQKKELLNEVKGTFLWELLLGMDFLVGSINGVKLTEDPFSYTDFLNKDQSKFVGPGINEILKTDLTKNDLYWWNTFYLDIPILDAKLYEMSKIKKYHSLQTYILLRIMPEVAPKPSLGYPGKKKQIRYLVFSIYNDSSESTIKKKVIGSNSTLKILKESDKIKQIIEAREKIKQIQQSKNKEKHEPH